MGDRSFWLPVGGHICTQDGTGRVHATEWAAATLQARQGRKTLPTMCGRQRTRPVVHAAVGPDGEDNGVVAASWPPPVKVHDRCALCWVATGQPRPHRSWRNVQALPEQETTNA